MIDNDGKYVVVIKKQQNFFVNSITYKLVAFVQETGESLSKNKDKDKNAWPLVREKSKEKQINALWSYDGTTESIFLMVNRLRPTGINK